MVEQKEVMQKPNSPNRNVIWINYSTGHVGVDTTEDIDKAKKIFDDLHKTFMNNIRISESYMENKRIN